MFYLAYVSTARELLNQEELARLLATCERNNTAAGVSGALVYAGGSFLQVLEGDEVTVRALFGRIRRDSRHHDIILLDEGDEDEREFGEWSMAFRDLTGQMAGTPGFEELMNILPSESAGGAGRLQRLVGSARQQLRTAL